MFEHFFFPVIWFVWICFFGHFTWQFYVSNCTKRSFENSLRPPYCNSWLKTALPLCSSWMNIPPFQILVFYLHRLPFLWNNCLICNMSNLGCVLLFIDPAFWVTNREVCMNDDSQSGTWYTTLLLELHWLLMTFL